MAKRLCAVCDHELFGDSAARSRDDGRFLCPSCMKAENDYRKSTAASTGLRLFRPKVPAKHRTRKLLSGQLDFLEGDE